MTDMNVVVINGRLGQAIEVKYLPSGKTCVEFDIANTKHFLKDGAWQEYTHWISIKAYGDLAERQVDRQKGDLLCINAAVSTSSWQDKHGQKRKDTYLEAQSIQFMAAAKGKTDGSNVAAMPQRNQSQSSGHSPQPPMQQPQQKHVVNGCSNGFDNFDDEPIF